MIPLVQDNEALDLGSIEIGSLGAVRKMYVEAASQWLG
jgi:hypothetical protein